MYAWGRFHVPQKIVRELDIKDHEMLEFELINKAIDVKIKQKRGFIDLACLINENAKIIPRTNNFITLYFKQKVPITLPRFIEIYPKLIELCYLIHGDGHYKDKLYFSNSNYNLHKFVINAFEDIFYIPKDIWRFRVNHKNPENIELAKYYWIKNLRFNSNQFYPNHSISEFRTKEFGNLRSCLDNTIIALIFRFVFNRIKNLNKKNSLIALNGLLEAEGSARLESTSLHKITLSFNNQEKRLFDKVLAKTGLSRIFKISQNRRYELGKWEYKYEFLSLFLKNGLRPFNANLKRAKNSVYGFLNHSYTKTLVKYLNALKDRECTVKDIQDKLNHRCDSILNTLKKARYQEFIIINGKGINHNPYKISINNKGKEFLKIIKTLKLQLKQVEVAMEDELPFEKIKRNVIIKQEAETNTKYGLNPHNRGIETLINYGIVNINKNQGPTSHQVSDYVQKILNIKKAGHSGTLE